MLLRDIIMLSSISRAITFLLLTGSILCLLQTPAINASSSSTELQLQANRTRRSSSDPSCRRVFKPEFMEIPFEGCITAKIRVRGCEGRCASSTVHFLTQLQPAIKRFCNCCAPVKYRMKVKNVKVICGPEEVITNKKVYIPRVTKDGCGCVRC